MKRSQTEKEENRRDCIFKVDFETWSKQHPRPIDESINVLATDLNTAIVAAETYLKRERDEENVRFLGVALLAKAELIQ